jgi:hypothetical protein
MMRKLTIIVAIIALLYASGAWALAYVGPSIGIAQWVNPASATTLATTPNTGVVIPANTKTVAITVDGAPIRFFFGSTNPTGTVGLKLEVGGPYYIDNKSSMATTFKFINDSSGTATVTVEYYGQP